MHVTPLETERRAPAFGPARPERSLVSWLIVTAVAVALLTVGIWFLIDYLTPTDGEAMLRDYVGDWENGELAGLSDYFTLNGTLVNATTGRSFQREDIRAELSRLAGDASVNIHHVVVGSSDRIASAQIDVTFPTGDALDGVSVWEIVGGEIRQQTISYVMVYAPES